MSKKKIKSTYVCQSCGAKYAKWQGKCTTCNEWNTIEEEIVADAKNTTQILTGEKSVPKKISEISAENFQRIITKDAELNRVLGGGIVPGSLVLIGGEPGIGKSTLLLQIALQGNQKILYVSGEESEQQIKLRSERIKENNNNLFIYCETHFETVLQEINKIKPEIVIFDSIQTLYTQTLDSAPGNISQIREVTYKIMQFAKHQNIACFLVGHVTKDGMISGPKILEHMVDVVLNFEGERHYNYRILRTTKNRFGSTLELGIYEMQSYGLRQINNPSELFLSQSGGQFSGVAIAATLEGERPILIECQALVSDAAYGTPQRSSIGFNLKRLSMLLAILEKKFNFKMGTKDVFVNLAGGIKIDDPALDLSVISAILSSQLDSAVPNNYTFASEVGLTGELRGVNKIEQRIAEAEKLGFKKIFVSKKSTKSIQKSFNIEIVTCSKVQEVFRILFK